MQRHRELFAAALALAGCGGSEAPSLRDNTGTRFSVFDAPEPLTDGVGDKLFVLQLDAAPRAFELGEIEVATERLVWTCERRPPPCPSGSYVNTCSLVDKNANGKFDVGETMECSEATWHNTFTRSNTGYEHAVTLFVVRDPSTKDARDWFIDYWTPR